MPRRALRCVVEINLQAVTCPGVYIPRRDDVYLSVCLLGQVRRTQLVGPLFPMIFHDKFCFDKVFYSAYEPAQVADSLEDEPVIIELIQLSDIYEGGKLLASYEANARDFLYPYPSYTSTYGTQDREILMERSLDFPGISPKLEFSSRTTIRECTAPIIQADDVLYTTKSTRKSRTRTKSPCRKSIAYSRPTVSSITRTRSLSPSMRRKFEALDVVDRTDERPPFVVRKSAGAGYDRYKVESRSLIGRDPGTRSPKQKLRCMHGTYGDPSANKKRALSSTRYATDYLDLYTDNLRPSYTRQALSSYSDVDYLSDCGGNDLLDLTSTRSRYRSPSPRYRSPTRGTDLLDLTSTSQRYRSPSPRYRSPSPLRSSVANRYWSPTRSEVIQARVDRALERNRLLDKYDTLYPYSSYRYRSDTSTLDDLELDLEISRRRRNYNYY